MSFYSAIYKLLARPIRAIWRVEAHGTENIPEGGCVLICNHTAFSDVLALEVASHRQIFFMGKAELFKIPLLKNLISALGAFPVNRGGADITSIKRTISEIESGKIVGIFPQGTRCPDVDPRTTEVKGGVGMIVYRAKADILPVYIDGAAGRTRSFHKNKVTFGKVIPFAELEAVSGGKRDYQAMTEYAFSKVCELKYGEGNGAVIKAEEQTPAQDGAQTEEQSNG